MRLALLILLSLVSVIAGAQQNTKTSGGRFQLIQLSSMRRDQFLLDTQTGKIWSSNCVAGSGESGDCVMTAWMLMRVESITASKNEITKDADAIEKWMRERGSKSKGSDDEN